MQRLWTVYKHTSPSGKVYIGITSDIKHRWRAGGTGYKGSTRIWYAIQKYGFDNFQHDILYTDLTQQQAEEKEIALIAQYNATDTRFGYNLQQGGKIRLFNEESRRKLSASLMGHSVSPKVRNLLADINSKAIICIETGYEFKSIQEAANWCKVHRTTVNQVIRGLTQTAGGYHWALKGQEDTVNIDKRKYYR